MEPQDFAPLPLRKGPHDPGSQGPEWQRCRGEPGYTGSAHRGEAAEALARSKPLAEPRELSRVTGSGQGLLYCFRLEPMRHRRQTWDEGKDCKGEPSGRGSEQAGGSEGHEEEEERHSAREAGPSVTIPE